MARETLANALDGVSAAERAAFSAVLERMRGNLSRKAPAEAAAGG